MLPEPVEEKEEEPVEEPVTLKPFNATMKLKDNWVSQ